MTITANHEVADEKFLLYFTCEKYSKNFYNFLHDPQLLSYIIMF